MACCTNPNADEYTYDDYTRGTITPDVSQDSTATEDSEIRNVDYRKVTPLFQNIERENWEGVLTFLSTGRWSNSMLASSNDHFRSPSPEIQAKTWVTAYNRRGDPEWSQLPLHAAISYLAPHVVIQKLCQLYPKGVHCTDNEGMLPIHLAFGFGAQDNVLALLLDPFPASINEKGLGDRYPYECCELGPNKTRGKVFKIVTDQVIHRTRRGMENELRDFTNQAVKTIGVAGPDDLSEKKITQFILELLKDRKELQEIKEQARASSRSASPSSALSPKTSGKSSRIGKRKSSKMVAKTPAAPKVTGRKPSSKNYS
uniref:Uncharacterized protein n=1 Tax=Entomoneis paludosa TaxID=265537 RepID=A0A7S2YD32_9STRA|eukprot:CAMPEP_0172463918 /NCGR_PEP_ID=MMETSP1065-20121228/48824_1 /TAXON_ID=265537 /ORGANISM="Amphiprora paludosa, Strain CCMP125" /LENGTH=313 /DNA_ID=CAMNT_0013219999 /DNA_START=54 /DNA_END=995 /DNA_ORIENTATION=+